MARYLYSELSMLVAARQNCLRDSNGSNANPAKFKHYSEMAQTHSERIAELVREHMPSGSGFDNGTAIDLNSSHAERLTFTTSFHHMNDGGMYDGWTEHVITATPSFDSHLNLRISGRNRNAIKDHIYDSFYYALLIDLKPQQPKLEKLALVYQAGIANVFAVSCFNCDEFGRDAKRLIQSDFRTAEAFCNGASHAGVSVAAFGCNRAGDVTNERWTDILEPLPFSDQFCIPQSWRKG